MVITFRLIPPPRRSDECLWPDSGPLGGQQMNHLTYRPGPDRHESTPDDSLKFPGARASQARADATGDRPERHPAELAIERAQRRLDNLREVLGPAFGRDCDGPRAA